MAYSYVVAFPPWWLLAVPLRFASADVCGFPAVAPAAGVAAARGCRGAVTGLRGWGFPDCFALRPETPTRSGPSPPVGGGEEGRWG
ncbi:hypothetical protein Srufu_057750 [Streptomyces libani subsp. rufus]|nr:hypothetical protein Srufu_057750 [Streptomyces libani subsp. rufus]